MANPERAAHSASRKSKQAAALEAKRIKQRNIILVGLILIVSVISAVLVVTRYSTSEPANPTPQASQPAQPNQPGQPTLDPTKNPNNLGMDRPTVTGENLPNFGDTPETTGTKDPGVGKMVPEITGKDFIKGEQVVIGPKAGKPQAIAVMAHWCPHCDHEVGEMPKYVADGDLPEGIQLIAITAATSQENPNFPPTTWLTKHQWPGLALNDFTPGPNILPITEALGVQGFPSWTFVDKHGKVVARQSGVLTGEQIKEFAQLALSAP